MKIVSYPSESNTSIAPTDTQVASLDNKMIGVVISQAGGARGIVRFNNHRGQVPAPITSTSYNFPGSGLVRHILAGRRIDRAWPACRRLHKFTVGW